MARFVSIPTVSTQDSNPGQIAMANAIKQNIELLTGMRGEDDGSSRAVLRGDIRLKPLQPQAMTRVSATGAGFVVSSVQVASATDHAAAVTDLQTLANDVAYLRAVVIELIKELQGK